MIAYAGGFADRGRALLAAVPAFFASYRPAASLLHGDLWAGNAAAFGNVPVIFDPAAYFGDRETDVAMTRLFGGYGSAFHEAYAREFTLDTGYSRREPLYQLYHVLNHVNLFGSAYAGRAASLIDRLLAGL